MPEIDYLRRVDEYAHTCPTAVSNNQYLVLRTIYPPTNGVSVPMLLSVSQPVHIPPTNALTIARRSRG